MLNLVVHFNIIVTFWSAGQIIGKTMQCGIEIRTDKLYICQKLLIMMMVNCNIYKMFSAQPSVLMTALTQKLIALA